MQPEPYEHLGLMKSRLAFLPEIRREVQSLLKLVQGKSLSRRFKNVLTHLEKLPNNIQEILEESNAEKLDPIFYEFELIKPVIRVEILAIRTYLELGLNDWNIGKHITRDATGLQIDEFKVINLWGANIIPSYHSFDFQMPARIAAVRCDSNYRIAFGLGRSSNNVSTSIIQINLPLGWIDPLTEAHRQLSQVQSEEIISLDGIVYELGMISDAGKNSIEFVNPEIRTNASFLELEKSLFSVAETVVNRNGSQSDKDYLSVWQRYLVNNNA